MPLFIFAPLLPHYPDCDHADQADNHRKGILEQVSALPEADPGGKITHQAGRSIDQHTIDQPGIRFFPQAIADIEWSC